MMKPDFRCANKAAVARFGGLLCVLASANCALAQVPQTQWPAMPTVVTMHPNDDPDLIPTIVLPPDAKSPDLDPLLSLTNPLQKTKGTLAYFSYSGYGGHNITFRSLSGPRMLPESHTIPPSDKGLSEIASYGFHEGEYGGGNPQFSPDGQVLLYEQSDWRPQYGTGYLYEWDMKTGKVRQLANRTIAYLLFFWSPDSQSIAYVSGGEESGKPAQLNIADRSTAKTRTVALPQGVSLMLDTPIKRQAPIVPIAWASPTNILFSGVPDAGANKQTPAHPNIYQATEGKTTLVVPDAYAPNPSPDGRWIACFGWPDAAVKATKNQSSQAVPNLYLFDRRAKKRFLVRALPAFGRRELENGGFPPQQIVRWTPDSRRLILSEESYEVKGQSGTATSTFSSLDIPQTTPDGAQWSQALRIVATLHATDAVAYTRPMLHFGPLQMSADGNHLYLATFKVTGQEKGNLISERSLQRVSLTDGQVDVIARFSSDNLLGFDWHEAQN